MGTAADARQELLGAAVDALTPRQKYMVAVIGETDGMAEAAEQLGVHPSALSARLRAIASRLGLAGTSDLVRLARRRQVLDASTQAVVGIDSTGMCVFANQRTCEMVGYSRAELVGACLHDLLHSPGVGGATFPLEECPIHAVVLGRGLTHAGETVLFHRDGSPLWVAYSAVAAGESGEGSVTVVTWRDQTSQFRMERELSLSNTRLEMALDAAGVTAFEVDLDSEEVTGWGRFLDHGPETTLRDFLERVSTVDGHDLSSAPLSDLPAGTTLEGEYLVRSSRGERRDAHIRLRKLAGGVAEPARLLGVAVDVTAVRDVERVHEAVLELSNEALVGIDSWGTVSTWNAAAEKLFGFPKGQALGAKLEDLIIPPRYLPAYRESLKAIRERHHQDPVSRGPLEATALDRHGREFPVEWTVTWVPLHAGMVCRAFVRDISLRKSAEAQLLSGAVADELTGLPNKALLEDRLRQARARLARTGGSLAVLFVDLDRFKLLNDSLGHAAGDRVLEEMARRMKASVRPADTVARFGGDEFVVICEDLSEYEAVKVAERVLAELQRPLVVDGQEISSGGSIGIALTNGRSAVAEDLLRDADAAMYRAKQLGRGRAEIFNDAMRHRALQRLRMEADLRGAITSGGLRLYYQPIVDTRSEQMRGAEALVRWDHPEHGLLPPSEFISLAEETGLIVPLGRWVLHTACADFATWPVPADFHLTVNLAARQLLQEDLLDTVSAVLGETGLEPSRLYLEITETGMMEESITAVSNLHRLHDLGVRIAIDDFGTGYSSLLRLRRFPIDLLKMDRLFVSGARRNPDDTAILTAIADLARALGVDTLAEGVETQEQLDFVRSLGCRLAQGFRWSPPRPEPSLRKLLKAPSLRPEDSQSGPGHPESMPVVPPLDAVLIPNSRRRVVLVDDSAGDRSLIRNVLASSGAFDVVGEAASAEEAVELLRRSRPDMVLLDMSLPGQDGLTALASLREASPASLITLLSGFVSDGLARAAMNAGASACLDKGISPAHLVSDLLALFPAVS